MGEGKKAVLLIVILGLIVYANSLFNGFVGDDFGQLVDNPSVHTIQNIPAFFTGGSFNDGSGRSIGIYYKPLMMTVWSVIYSIFGARAFFFHSFSLVLHIANSLLVWTLFKHYFSKKLSLFLTLVFLLHPFNNEVVVYISNLQDGLFFFFGMLALIFSLKTPVAKNVFFTILFLICSLLSKATGVAFLAIILLVSMKNLWYILPIFFSYALIHYSVVGAGFSNDQPFPIMRLTLGQRLLNIPRVIWFYLKTFFFPINPALGYQGVIKNTTFENFYAPILGIGLGLSLWSRLFFKIRNSGKDLKILIFFSGWLVIGLLLHAQIIPLDFIVADRWFYLPMVGILGIIGVTFNNVKNATVFGIIVLTLLGVRTWIRNFDWKDGLTLAAHDTKIVQDSYSLYAYYGVELYNAGRYDEAIDNLNKSIALAPYWHLNWNYLGQTQERKGSLEKNRQLITQAEQSYKKAIANSRFDLPYVNYSHLLIYYQDEKTANNFIENSLAKFPRSPGLWYNLALLELLKEDRPKALQAAQNAYALNPTDKETQKLFLYLSNNLPVKVEKADF